MDKMLCASCNTARRKQERQASKPVKLNARVKKVTDQQRKINAALSLLYSVIDPLRESVRCDAYPNLQWDDHDHTISQKRCKELGRIDLIADSENIEFSSRKAHMEWESYKSGKFIEHANFNKRMAFVKKHDPEMYAKRIQVYHDKYSVSRNQVTQ